VSGLIRMNLSVSVIVINGSLSSSLFTLRHEHSEA
jgi:hypothetical protein